MASSRKVGPVAAGNRGKGRKKGVPNKITKSAREAMELAFQGIGGVKELVAWAQDNKTEFYKLYARLIPVQHQGDPEKPIVHEHRVIRWGDLEVPI